MKRKLLALPGVLLLSLMCLAARVNAAEAENGQKIYGIGSVSKMFGTAAVMLLADRGEVRLDAPVSDYLPEFTMADDRYRQITVRMLLNHSSGIMGTTNENCFLTGPDDVNYHDVLMENLKTQQLKAEPGEYSVYCNDGFTLAEMIVERVSGMRFAQFIETEFSVPLGLENTTMPELFTGDENIAPVYYKNRLLPYENVKSLASGGIYSTAEDLCRFSRLFMEDGAGILSENAVDAMRFPEYMNQKICVQEGDSNFAYGLGWDSVHAYPFSRYGITALTKGGNTGNYSSGLIVLPEEGICAAVTAAGGGEEQCLMLAGEIITEVLLEEGLITTEQMQAAESPAADLNKTAEIPQELKKYEGIYASGGLFRLELTDRNTALLSSLENERDIVQEYVYTEDGSFVSTEGKYISYTGDLTQTTDGIGGLTAFRFSEEPNGKTYILGTAWLLEGGGAQSAVTAPFAERIEENRLPDSARRAWENRDGQRYYRINDAFNSFYYLTQPCVKVEMLSAFSGYTNATEMVKNCIIVDEDNAECRLDLPVMIGRDLMDYHFYRKEGTEYLTLGGGVYIEEKSMPKLDAVLEDGGTFRLEGQENQWLKIHDKNAGQRLEIKAPEDGAYYIYNKDDECVDSSQTVDKRSDILLPDGGKILLAGRKGAVFTITRKN